MREPDTGARRSADRRAMLCGLALLAGPPLAPPGQAADVGLPRIRVSADGRGFVTETGKPFVPFGVNYFRPGTGWAPQLWKQFDADATRRDFARLKDLGATCVRVFLSYGSFYQAPGVLDTNGLARLDRFLDLAEEAGIYVHPTGPDHWEGTPEWARADRYADEQGLAALERFWTLLAARYRDRPVLFAYDLLNEPEIRWDTPPMREKWPRWLAQRFPNAAALAQAWGLTNSPPDLHSVPIPPRDAPPGPALLACQSFRESLADDWTRRQAAAIKAVAPKTLVTVGLIQWAVPALLAAPWQYAAFRPQRQARYLDFLEVHFYPLARGFYAYGGPEDELRNLAYAESVVREVARAGKPVVLAEFGWYGGGQLTIDGGKHPPATEDQQAQWCKHLVETTAGLATGWLNWGLYDHPQAGDVTQLTGLLTAQGQLKAWGREFQQLAARFARQTPSPPSAAARPDLDWDRCLTSSAAMSEFREAYYQAFLRARPRNRNRRRSRPTPEAGRAALAVSREPGRAWAPDLQTTPGAETRMTSRDPAPTQ